MAYDTTSTIDPCSIYIEPAQNGYILCYTCKTQKMGCSCGPYDMSYSYDEKRLVYKPTERNQAFAKMDELYKEAGGMMDEEADE